MRKKNQDIISQALQDLSPIDYNNKYGENSKADSLIAPINKWRPQSPDELFLTSEARKCIIEFDKIFNVPKLGKYNIFVVRKDSYSTKLPIFCHYINYFLNKYDTEHELLAAYMNIKFAIDNEEGEIHFEGNDQFQQFVDYTYDVIMTKSITDKVSKLVEDNYTDDIESGNNSKYASKEKMYLESLEFTNEHVKTLYKISFCIKILTPVIFHYCAKNNVDTSKNSNNLFKAFKQLFVIFSSTCNMYNKLYVYVKTKVMENKSNNDKIYQQREIFGIDETSVIDKFLRRIIISDNLVKLEFCKEVKAKDNSSDSFESAQNPTGFIKTVIKYQLTYFLKEQHPKTLTEITYERNADGLSGVDVLEMSADKLDESEPILADYAVENEIDRMLKMYDIEISDDELNYYVKNFNIQNIHKDLILSVLASKLGSFVKTLGIRRISFIKLALLLKKKILKDSGIDDPSNFSYKVFLPYILTGNVKEKINTRLIRNAEFREDCKNSYIISDLLDNQYKYLEEIEPDKILTFLSTINNTVFTYCCYENQEILGEVIVTNKNTIADELGFFLRTI